MAPVAAAVEAVKPQTKLVWTHAWMCNHCSAECVPIRTESRCLCGHRNKEHAKLSSGSDKANCGAARCPCPGFFFIMAEGAWVLRCNCKHKHVEHDPVTHKCAKPGCKCDKFFSPFVCNCNHAWGDHTQVAMQREVRQCPALPQQRVRFGPVLGP